MQKSTLRLSSCAALVHAHNSRYLRGHGPADQVMNLQLETGGECPISRELLSSPFHLIHIPIAADELSAEKFGFLASEPDGEIGRELDWNSCISSLPLFSK